MNNLEPTGLQRTASHAQQCERTEADMHPTQGLRIAELSNPSAVSHPSSLHSSDTPPLTELQTMGLVQQERTLSATVLPLQLEFVAMEGHPSQVSKETELATELQVVDRRQTIEAEREDSEIIVDRGRQLGQIVGGAEENGGGEAIRNELSGMAHASSMTMEDLTGRVRPQDGERSLPSRLFRSVRTKMAQIPQEIATGTRAVWANRRVIVATVATKIGETPGKIAAGAKWAWSHPKQVAESIPLEIGDYISGVNACCKAGRKEHAAKNLLSQIGNPQLSDKQRQRCWSSLVKKEGQTLRLEKKIKSDKFTAPEKLAMRRDLIKLKEECRALVREMVDPGQMEHLSLPADEAAAIKETLAAKKAEFQELSTQVSLKLHTENLPLGDVYRMQDIQTEIHALEDRLVNPAMRDKLNEYDQLMQDASKLRLQGLEKMIFHGTHIVRKTVSAVATTVNIFGVTGGLANLTAVGGAIGLVAGSIGTAYFSKKLVNDIGMRKQLKAIEREGKDQLTYAAQYRKVAGHARLGGEVDIADQLDKKADAAQQKGELMLRFVKQERIKVRNQIVHNSLGIAENVTMALGGLCGLLSLIPGANMVTAPLAITFSGVSIALFATQWLYDKVSARNVAKEEKKLLKGAAEGKFGETKGREDSALGVQIKLAVLIREGEAPQSVLDYMGIKNPKRVEKKLQKELTKLSGKGKYDQFSQWAEAQLQTAGIAA